MDNNSTHWAKGQKFDVRFSLEDYLEIVDCIHDDRLSREGIFRFKNLAEINSFAIPSTVVFCFPIAYGLAKFFTGR